MNLLKYIIINLLLFSSWFALLYKRREELSFVDRLIGAFILGLAQVILTEMLLGIVFKRLYPTPLFLLNTFISLFIIGIALIKTQTITIFNEMGENILKLSKMVKKDIVLSLIMLILITSICWIIFIGYLFPSYTWDGLWYHLPIVGFILQSGAIQENPTPFMIDQFMNIFPKNIELFFLWNIIFLKSDVITDLSQLFFLIMGILAVYSIAIKLEMEKRYAIYSGIIFFFTPISILQSSTNYVDVAVAVLFIIAINFVISGNPNRLSVSLSGIAMGILLGSKGSGPLFVGVLLTAISLREVLLYLNPFKLFHDERGRPLLKRLAIYLLYILLPSFLLGGYWYAKNWFLYGNPVYPMEIAILNTTVFKGLYNGIIDPEPDLIKSLSPLSRLVHVWLERVDYYLYDSRFSGFGPIWFILSLPSIAFSTIDSLKMRRYRFFFLGFVLILTFILYPRNWNTRYVIFIVGLGSLSIGIMLEYFKERGSILRVIILILVLYTAMFSNSPCITPEKVGGFIKLPPSRRTIVEHDPFNIHLQARQEYGYWRWIRDNISGGDTIAYTFEPLFLAPLWNEAFSNGIAYIKAGTYNEWIQRLKDIDVTHVLIRTNSPEDRWIEEENRKLKKGFQTLYSDENYKILRFDD